MDSIDGIPEDAPQIRLCHIKKRTDFNGYGFNLHAEKSKPGQYIGTVDRGSPAERAGLQEGDRIVEVNDVNICHENHKQVVARIKVMPDETKLLVVDKETEEYYRNKEIVIRRDLPTVIFLTSDDDDYDRPPTNNNYTAEDHRRSKKKLGNVCHQSSVVEDEEDGEDEINYAMQRPNSNPPPLPDSAPPMTDEDDDGIKQELNDRNSLGGSSYDKDKQLDTDVDLLPPPPNEAEMLGNEEEMNLTDAANKITVTATIESSSEDGDDQQEEGGYAKTDSIPSIPEAIQPQDDFEEGQINDISKVEEEHTSTIIGLSHDHNLEANNVSSNEKPSVGAIQNKDRHSDTSSCSSFESISRDLPEATEGVIDNITNSSKEKYHEEEKDSIRSAYSGVEQHEPAKDAITTDVNSVDAAEWNRKMASMGGSADTKSISSVSAKSEDSKKSIGENEFPPNDVQMRTTRDTIISKENVKIEVTRTRKKTEPAFPSDSLDDNPPMPAPRTVSPISEKSSTASIEEPSPRSFSPSSLDHMNSVSLPPNTGDVGDSSSNQRGGRNWDGLNLNMTAREMRERIGSKKKKDPRKEDRIDFRTKYEMIQAL